MRSYFCKIIHLISDVDVRHGIDCDEVFPGIVLGNGATVRKKEYLKSIGVSHVLNAAEFRGVNVGEDYFGPGFSYKGLRVEDTPQTQICRWTPLFPWPCHTQRRQIMINSSTWKISDGPSNFLTLNFKHEKRGR